MSTIVGTNIEVTNIKFDSDTTSMIISDAGQVTIQGEGSATTNLQQGLAKSWVNWNGTGTVAVRDSINFTSLTDNGTGDYTIVIASAMGNANYCASGMCGAAANSQEAISRESFSNPATTTTSRYITAYNNTNTEDVPYAGVCLLGDLA